MNKIVSFIATKASQAGGYLLQKGKQVVSNARALALALMATATGTVFAQSGDVSAGASALQGVTSDIAA